MAWTIDDVEYAIREKRNRIKVLNRKIELVQRAMDDIEDEEDNIISYAKQAEHYDDAMQWKGEQKRKYDETIKILSDSLKSTTKGSGPLEGVQDRLRTAKYNLTREKNNEDLLLGGLKNMLVDLQEAVEDAADDIGDSISSVLP